jgi:cupin 2 domain-containing protein
MAVAWRVQPLKRTLLRGMIGGHSSSIMPISRPIVSATRNIFAGVPTRADREEIEVLAALPGARIERIVSTGQASPPGFWYDQGWTEWVVVLAGSAGLLIEGEEAPRILAPGDYLELPPNFRHRLEWTAADRPTVWLAVHAR